MIQLTYPVVLVHGYIDVPAFSGTWKAAEKVLDEQGIRRFTVQIPPHGSIIERTDSLIKQIQKKVEKGETVHIFGHSMGGINARHLTYRAHHEDVGFKVKTVTTFATPHRGVKAINLALGVRGDADFANALRNILGTDVQAFGNLTERFMEKFNEETPDVEGVKYFSWAGDCTVPSAITSIPWAVTRPDGPTDGLVNVDSAVWTQAESDKQKTPGKATGTHLGTFPGIDHVGMTPGKAVTLTLPHISAAEKGATSAVVQIDGSLASGITNRLEATTTTATNIALAPARIGVEALKAPSRIMGGLFS